MYCQSFLHCFKFIDNPFILMKVQGFPCQKVCGARKGEWSIKTGTLDDPFAKESVINGTIKPAGSTSRQAVQLRFCYYAKMKGGLYLPNVAFDQSPSQLSLLFDSLKQVGIIDVIRPCKICGKARIIKSTTVVPYSLTPIYCRSSFCYITIKPLLSGQHRGRDVTCIKSCITIHAARCQNLFY